MTTKINLLPWRNALREQRKKAFLTNLVLAGIVGVAAVGGGYMFFSQQLSEQNDVNQMITQENAKLDEQLKALEGLDARRAQIEERMKLIEGLQGQRPVVVRVADELVRLIPQDLYVTKFKRMGDKFTIEGKAQDPNVVAELLRGLEMSPWFRNAFMNSYIAADDKAVAQNNQPNTSNNPNQQTSLVERPETKYGTFIITVDLEHPKPVEQGEKPEGTDAQLPPQEVAVPAGAAPQPTGARPAPVAPAPNEPVPAPNQPVAPAQAPAQPPAPAQPAPAPAQPAPPPPVPANAGSPAPTPAPADNSGVAK